MCQPNGSCVVYCVCICGFDIKAECQEKDVVVVRQRNKATETAKGWRGWKKSENWGVSNIQGFLYEVERVRNPLPSNGWIYTLLSIIRKIATAKSMSLEEILSIVTKLLAFDIMTKEISADIGSRNSANKDTRSCNAVQPL